MSSRLRRLWRARRAGAGRSGALAGAVAGLGPAGAAAGAAAGAGLGPAGAPKAGVARGALRMQRAQYIHGERGAIFQGGGGFIVDVQ